MSQRETTGGAVRPWPSGAASTATGTSAVCRPAGASAGLARLEEVPGRGEGEGASLPDEHARRGGGVKRWLRTRGAGVRAAAPSALRVALAAALGLAVGLSSHGASAQAARTPAPPTPPRNAKSSVEDASKDASKGASKGASEAASKDAKAPAPPGPPKGGATVAPKDAAVGRDGAKGARGTKALTPEQRAMRGLVVIERAGTALALGSVLARDGRILTALSPLGAGNSLTVRYGDGSTVKVKVGHHDRAWDLALLVPQSGKWAEGLTASMKDPLAKDTTAQTFSLKNAKPSLAAITLRSKKTLLGADDAELQGALELGTRVNPQDLGAPVIDADGRVIAVLGRGCAPNDDKPCTPVAFGAPIAAIKSFLKSAPTSAQTPPGWLGIQGVSDATGAAKGVRVALVHPESPADEAALKGGGAGSGDVIVAVDGDPVATPEELADAIKQKAVGEKVPLLVLSGGKYKTVTVLLRAAPDAKSTATPSHPAALPPAPKVPAAVKAVPPMQSKKPPRIPPPPPRRR